MTRLLFLLDVRSPSDELQILAEQNEKHKESYNARGTTVQQVQRLDRCIKTAQGWTSKTLPVLYSLAEKQNPTLVA